MALQTWLKTSSTGSSESTCRRTTERTVTPVSTNVKVQKKNGTPAAAQGHTDLPDDATVLVEGDDGFCGFVVKVQALLDGLLIVVRATACLATLQQPLGHGLRLGVHVQQQAGFADLQ